MKLLGSHYLLEAFELANAGDRHVAARIARDRDTPAPSPSREEIAAAWRRWAGHDQLARPTGPTASARSARRPGLRASVPRSGI